MIPLSNQGDFLALLATLPPGSIVYPGEVPDSPYFPYILVRSFTPRVGERSLNRTIHSRVDRWRVTVAGLTHDAVSIIEAQVRNVLEGARISGQRVEEIPNGIPIDEDLDVTLSNGAHPFYVVHEWRVMC